MFDTLSRLMMVNARADSAMNWVHQDCAYFDDGFLAAACWPGYVRKGASRFLSRLAHACVRNSMRLLDRSLAAAVRRSMEMRSRKKSEGLNDSGQQNPMLEKYDVASDAVPKYTTNPSDSSRSLSNIWKMLERGWWMVVTMVWWRLARSRREVITFIALNESRPVVGSSRKLGYGEDGRLLGRVQERCMTDLEHGYTH